MDPSVFARGLLVGFSIAAPVGPIGVLCVRRTLADGRAAGLFTGLGAATADAIYGGVAAFGVTIVSRLLLEQEVWLRLAGGLFLCVLGLRTFASRPAANAAPAPVRGVGLAGMYLSTLLLTLANPLTIVSFAGVFAGFGVALSQPGNVAPVVLVVGVFTGSAVWWLLLSSVVSLARDRLDSNALVWVNRFSGLLIVAFGLLALGSLFR